MSDSKLSKYVAVAAPAVSITALDALADDALMEVLRAAKAARVLASLATSSRQLCLLARSRMPLHLCVQSQKKATLVLRSQARGTLPFSGCTQLCIGAGALVAGGSMVAHTSVACVLGAAQHWAGLQQLQLKHTLKPIEEWPAEGVVDHCMLGVMSSLSGLKQLQQLKLKVPCISTSAAQHIGQLVQLTSLQLHMWDSTDRALPDLSALSRLAHLRDLSIRATAPVQPAAAAGPHSFPSSLTFLSIQDRSDLETAAPMAGWLTHLPGCPQLQQLEVEYGRIQHPSARPQALVGTLALHQRQLRSLVLKYVTSPSWMSWDAAVLGLPAAPGLQDSQWRPDAALGALRGLECLSVPDELSVTSDTEWHYLAQLSALTKLERGYFRVAPQQQASASLSVLELEWCKAYLGGYDLGLLLLACPVLQNARVYVGVPAGAAAVQAAGPRLPCHPHLRELILLDSGHWGQAAAAQFEEVAPVLGGLSELHLCQWPGSNSGAVRGGLPGMSSCSALTCLRLHLWADANEQEHPEQEDFLSMLRPLVHLQQLRVSHSPRLNASVVVLLQSVLPLLSSVELVTCGPLSPGGTQWQNRDREERVLSKVRQLLRQGLQVTVHY